MVLTRQWYKQTKAAMVIQKGCKFWVARLGWRRLKQMRNRTVVNSYVQSVIRCVSLCAVCVVTL